MSEVNEVVEEVVAAEEAPVAKAPVASEVKEPVEATKVADTSVSMEEMSEEIDKSFQKRTPQDDNPVWDNFKKLLDEKTVFEVKVETTVKGGAIAIVEDIKAFIPASHIAEKVPEKLDEYKGKKLEVVVITVDPEKNKLVLSARNVIRIKKRAAREEAFAKIKVEDVIDGKVESLKDYGAFIDLGEGVSGLLHVSQISWKRVKTPSEVLKVGDEIKVKVTDIKDGKISLSKKVLEEAPERAPKKEYDGSRNKKDDGPSHYSDGEKAGTTLGSLLGDLKL